MSSDINILNLPRDILPLIVGNFNNIDDLYALKRSCKTFSNIINIERSKKCDLYPACKVYDCKKVHFRSSVRNMSMLGRRNFIFDNYVNF